MIILLALLCLYVIEHSWISQTKRLWYNQTLMLNDYIIYFSSSKLCVIVVVSLYSNILYRLSVRLNFIEYVWSAHAIRSVIAAIVKCEHVHCFRPDFINKFVYLFDGPIRCSGLELFSMGTPISSLKYVCLAFWGQPLDYACTEKVCENRWVNSTFIWRKIAG